MKASQELNPDCLTQFGVTAQWILILRSLGAISEGIVLPHTDSSRNSSRDISVLTHVHEEKKAFIQSCTSPKGRGGSNSSSLADCVEEAIFSMVFF